MFNRIILQAMKIVGIIQARLGSSRLRYKMLLSLHGRPIIEWVVRRSKQAKKIDELIVAIPDTKENDILEKCVHTLNVAVFRGCETDVLKRFYDTAVFSQASHIVRICADNPLISGNEIDNLIEFYRQTACDYAYNHVPKNNTYPDGLGAEIVSFPLLAKLHREAEKPEHREHCFLYITDNPGRFDIKTFNPSDHRIACPEVKLDIDTFEDYYRFALKDFAIDTPDEDLVEIFKEPS